MTIDIKGLTQANELARAVMPPRFHVLDQLDRFVEGTAYEGRPGFWEAVDVPLMERAPAIVDPVADDAIRSYIDLILGEHRWPKLSVPGSDSQKLGVLLRRSRFAMLSKQVLRAGMSCGTGCAIFGLRNGRPFIDTVPAKVATPTLDPNTGAVLALEIRYAYVHTERVGGEWMAEARMYRRIIDDKRDVTYKPVPVLVADQVDIWVEDQAFEHGFGRCPVVWWPCDRDHSVMGEIDGHAIHEHVLDEIFAHDMSNSQLVRATLNAGDPQLYEIGVTAGFNPGERGRLPNIPTTESGGPLTSNADVRGAFKVNMPSGSVRKRGPGQVWQYPSSETKVGLLTLEAQSVGAIATTCDRLRALLCNAMSYVPLDPEKLPKGIVSGKALEALRTRQINRCDTLRDDVADGWLAPALAMLLLVSEKAAVDPEDVDVTWKPYFRMEPQDRAQLLTAEVSSAEKAISLIPTPNFIEALRRRIVRIALDDEDDEEWSRIDAEIEGLEHAALGKNDDEENDDASVSEVPDGERPGDDGVPPGPDR